MIHFSISMYTIMVLIMHEYLMSNVTSLICSVCMFYYYVREV